MRLHAWSTVWRDVEFDPRTGTASIIELSEPRPDTSVPTGFAHFERGLLRGRQIFALYKSGDAVFFSAGARRWRVDQPGVRFVHRRLLPFLSRFRVLEADRAAFSILYPHVGRLLAGGIDPTYDKLDEESDFFLAFVAEYAQSPEWQANVRERWASAGGP